MCIVHKLQWAIKDADAANPIVFTIALSAGAGAGGVGAGGKVFAGHFPMTNLCPLVIILVWVSLTQYIPSKTFPASVEAFA